MLAVIINIRGSCSSAGGLAAWCSFLNSNCLVVSRRNFHYTAHVQKCHTNTDLQLLAYNVPLLLHPFNDICSRTTWVSRIQKGKTSLDLNEARDDGVLEWHWHQLDHMQTIRTLLQTDNHNNTSSLNFYRLDAFPDAQPTVSKH